MWFTETRDESTHSLCAPSSLRKGKGLSFWAQFAHLSQENQRFLHHNGYRERPSTQPSAHRLRYLLLNFISESHRAGVSLRWQEVGDHSFLHRALHINPKGYSHTGRKELAAVMIKTCDLRKKSFYGAHVTGKQHRGLVVNSFTKQKLQ